MTADERERLAAQLREAERGEAASWTTWTTTWWWAPPLFGVWAAVFTWNVGRLGDSGGKALNLALVAASLAFIWWQRRRAGTYPHGGAPPEMRAVLAWYFVWAACVVVVSAAAYFLVDRWAGVAVAGLSTWAAVDLYGRAYERAAARVRERLS